MKQEAKKQNKKWLWLAIAVVALVAIVGIVLAFILPGLQDGQQELAANAKLYWNVDRALFLDPETGLSTREPSEDGLYRIRFAVDGEQVELTVVDDKRLVNYIDMMNVMGLVLDADGMVVEAVDAKTVATEVVSEQFVKKAEGDTIVINSSIAMNGMETTAVISDKTGIYDVSPTAQVVGQPSACAPLDKVTVFADAEGNVTHVFISERAVEAGVYWRVDRYYDVTTGQTTRKPDENGAYTMLFAHDGEQVELKCKDKELVNAIDAGNVMYAEFAFVLDEEGYIIQSVDVGPALSGALGCNNYNVTELNGSTFTAQRQLEASNQGDTYSATIGPECDIFLVENGCEASFVGERITELKMGDRITCYTDLDGNPILIFVINRLVDSPMYYSAERLYDGTAKETTRKPDSNGYYVFQMASQGKELTVRTKDKALASRMDSYTGQCMGLKLNGSIVEEVYDPNCVCGAWAAGEKRYVTGISGTVITAAAWSDLDNISNNVILPECKIYDATGYPGVKFGSETKLQMYDRVTLWQDISGNITDVFVIERYVQNAKIYYNNNRFYDGTTKETAREPDENGYYVFDMCCEGKEVQVKTKNKSFATFIDKQYAPIVALEVSGGIVKAVYPATAAVKYSYKQLNTNYIGKIEADGTIHAYYYDGDKRYERVNTFKMAENCKVYNVSTYYLKNRGEKTTLQVDDQVQAIATNPDGELVQIFVLKRKLDAPLYWKTEQKYNATTGETTRTPDADGYYVFDLAVNGEVKQFKTKDKTIASAVDKENQAFTIRTNGDVILGVYNVTVAKGIRDYTAGNFDVMALNGSKATVKRNYPLASNYGDSYDITFAKDCKFYDVSSYAENFGAATTLKVGDRIACYTNEKGEVAYCYITYKNTRLAGPVSLCEHCGKEVFWEPYTGPVYSTDVHYYLTHDMTRASQLTIGSAKENAEQNDIVFDLNGHTLTMEKRAFLVYGTLSILDSAGGSSVVSGNADAAFGGVAMVIGNGTMNLYNGTLTQAEDAPLSKRGGVLYTGDNAKLNIYGGTVTGGNAASGGDIYITGSSALNMSGGIVGDAYADTDGTITLSGAPKIAAFKLGAGVKLTLGELTEGAAVAVSATGVFTNTNEKAAAYAAYFTPVNKKDSIRVENNALVYVKAAVDLNKVDNRELAFAQGTTKALCPVCDQEVTWTALTGEKSVYPKDGDHYYLAEDVTFDGTADAFFLSPTIGTACLHLNGHNITATAQKAMTAYGGTLNVMGNGTVSGNYAKAWSGGATAHSTGSGTLNLVGGTYVKPVTNITENPIVFAANGTLNMYNGATVDGTGIPATKTATGVMVEHANAVFNMYGGTVRNGMTLSDGGNIRLSNGKMHISGGTVTGGDVYVTANGSATVSGAPAISKLVLPAGVKITLGELTEGADITVSADGIFTEENANAANYAAYFTPAGRRDSIQVQSNVLVYVKVPLDLNNIDNSNLVFAQGTTKALCPVCDQEVTWTALTGEKSVYSNNGDHYYLAEDITFEGTADAFFLSPGSGTACLHLNGHNLTATAQRAMTVNRGTVNVMGNGTVSGNYAVAWTGGAAAHATNGGTLNLFGGTYVKPVTNTTANPIVYIYNGTVNMYNGTIVDGTGIPGTYTATGVMLEHANAAFNMYGGTIQNGVGLGNGGNIRLSSGKLNISGGTVTGGDVYVAAGGVAALSGAPEISKLVLPAGVKITLGELAEGADITVSADGIFTEENANAAAYAGYFTPAKEGDSVVAEGNALKYAVPEEPAFDNSDLAFEEGTTDAVCPACEKKVTWQAVSGELASTKWLQADGHYYLSDDVTYAGTDQAVYSPTGAVTKTACLHLNGHDLTATAGRAIHCGDGTLNVMGNGTVSGSGTAYGGATIHTWGNGNLNLYGGTYTKGASQYPVIFIGSYTVNLYNGITVEGQGTTPSSYALVYLESNNAVVNMYGGVVQNGNSSGTCGNVKLYQGTFHMLGGTIQNGVGNTAGNLHAYNTGKVELSGGEIKNGSAYIAVSGAATLSGAPVVEQLVLPAGVTVKLDELTEGADITVSADGVFTEANTNADTYADYFKAYGDGKTVTVENDTLAISNVTVMQQLASVLGFLCTCIVI